MKCSHFIIITSKTDYTVECINYVVINIFVKIHYLAVLKQDSVESTTTSVLETTQGFGTLQTPTVIKCINLLIYILTRLKSIGASRITTIVTTSYKRFIKYKYISRKYNITDIHIFYTRTKTRS